MKKCPKCNLLKEEEDFYKRSDRNSVQAYCKLCSSLTRAELTRKRRKMGIDLLGGKCFKCGYNKYHGALHFHHPEPHLKDDMFHRIRNRKWEYIESVLLEQKCILLCANCHAEEHYM